MNLFISKVGIIGTFRLYHFTFYISYLIFIFCFHFRYTPLTPFFKIPYRTYLKKRRFWSIKLIGVRVACFEPLKILIYDQSTVFIVGAYLKWELVRLEHFSTGKIAVTRLNLNQNSPCLGSF